MANSTRGTEYNFPGASRVPYVSSPYSVRQPSTPGSGQDRLPLSVGGTARNAATGPLPNGMWSSSPSQDPRGGQVNPNAPWADHRPGQLNIASSPPRPQNLSEIMSSPYQHDPRRPQSDTSQGSSNYDVRPFSPTPDARAQAQTRIQSYASYIHPNDLAAARSQFTTDAELLRIGDDAMAEYNRRRAAASSSQETTKKSGRKPR